MICITGSNGKTTTTTLIGEMLKNSNQSIQVAGNIGTAASEIANKLQENEQLVLELSSFQLMGIDKFNPHIAVLLNIFEAHLDFHGTFDNYMEAKANIVKKIIKQPIILFTMQMMLLFQKLLRAHHLLKFLFLFMKSN